MSQTFLFASGKGGVGKSTVTASLGILLARAGSSVLLIDSDLGLRSLDSLLALENQVVFDLLDVLNGDCSPEDAMLSVPTIPDLKLLAAAQFARAKSLDVKKFRGLLQSLDSDFDFILIDCPAGIERGLRNVIRTEIGEAVLITTPDDLTVRDVERTAGILQEKGIDHPCLIVNRLRNDLVRTGEMPAAKGIADVLDLPLLGEIPEDETVYRAQLRHGTVADYDCEARNALVRIARRLRGETVPLPSYGKKPVSLFRRFFPRTLKEVTSLDSH